MKMDIVILAAGKGNRLKPITDKTPKPLIKIKGKTILERIFESLDPVKTGNVFIITKHLEEKIKFFVEKKLKSNLKVKCISQGKKRGTLGALLSAKKQLKDWFIVVNGDDLTSTKDLQKFYVKKNIIGIHKKESNYFEVIFNKDKKFKRFDRKSNKKIRYVATGCYTLNKKFLELKPEKTTENEFGIPQTIEKNINTIKPFISIQKQWHQINTKEELEKVKFFFNQS